MATISFNISTSHYPAIADLLDENNTIVKSTVIKTDGVINFTSVSSGTYKIRVQDTIRGFKLSEDIIVE